GLNRCYCYCKRDDSAGQAWHDYNWGKPWSQAATLPRSCPAWGHANSAKAKFCSKSGANLALASEVTRQTSWVPDTAATDCRSVPGHKVECRWAFPANWPKAEGLRLISIDLLRTQYRRGRSWGEVWSAEAGRLKRRRQPSFAKS